MAEDRFPAGQAAGQGGQESADGGIASALAAIVVAGRDAAVREALDRELSKRYGAD